MLPFLHYTLSGNSTYTYSSIRKHCDEGITCSHQSSYKCSRHSALLWLFYICTCSSKRLSLHIHELFFPTIVKVSYSLLIHWNKMFSGYELAKVQTTQITSWIISFKITGIHFGTQLALTQLIISGKKVDLFCICTHLRLKLTMNNVTIFS